MNGGKYELRKLTGTHSTHNIMYPMSDYSHYTDLADLSPRLPKGCRLDVSITTASTNVEVPRWGLLLCQPQVSTPLRENRNEAADREIAIRGITDSPRSRRIETQSDNSSARSVGVRDGRFKIRENLPALNEVVLTPFGWTAMKFGRYCLRGLI